MVRLLAQGHRAGQESQSGSEGARRSHLVVGYPDLAHAVLRVALHDAAEEIVAHLHRVRLVLLAEGAGPLELVEATHVQQSAVLRAPAADKVGLRGRPAVGRAP